MAGGAKTLGTFLERVNVQIKDIYDLACGSLFGGAAGVFHAVCLILGYRTEAFIYVHLLSIEDVKEDVV